jgi:hypothetical protein
VSVLLARRPDDAGLHGVIDTVGRDFLDLAVAPDDESRRPAAGWPTVTIPFGALAAIRSASPAG